MFGVKVKVLNYDFLWCVLYMFVDNECVFVYLCILSARVVAWSRDEAFRAERDDVDKVWYVLKNVW